MVFGDGNRSFISEEKIEQLRSLMVEAMDRMRANGTLEVDLERLKEINQYCGWLIDKVED